MSSLVRSTIIAAGLFGSVVGNFLSPGLSKCMDIKAELKDDGTRETLDDMNENSDPINVQLYTCHDQHNQQFEIIGGTIKSASLGRCVTATGATANSNVQLVNCEDGNELQQWDLTAYNYAKLKGTDQCIDVMAAQKDDGTRENWTEIKNHTTVNVHLYNCHDPTTTERVNQLWSWASVSHDLDQKWAVGDKVLPAASRGTGSGVLAASAAAVMGFVLGGLVVGRVAQRRAATLQSGAELLAED